MTTKTLYFLSTITTLASSTCQGIQDEGVPPNRVVTTNSWQVSTTPAVGWSARMIPATTVPISNFTSTDALTPPSLSTSVDFQTSFRTDLPINGVFAAGTWSLALIWRDNLAGKLNQGRVGFRIWKSATAGGGTPVEMTTSVLLTNTITPSNSSYSTTTATWTQAAPITFNNEYLWVQCEWIVTATASSAAIVVMSVDGTTTIITSDFTPTLASSARAMIIS